MAEDDSTSVGGVSFSIDLSLAEFEANLARAETLAREHAQRIKTVLGSASTTGPGGVPGAEAAANNVRQAAVAAKIPPIVAVASVDLSQFQRDLLRATAMASEAVTQIRQMFQTPMEMHALPPGRPTPQQALGQPRGPRQAFPLDQDTPSPQQALSSIRQGNAPTQRQAELQARYEQAPFSRRLNRQMVGELNPADVEAHNQAQLARQAERAAQRAAQNADTQVNPVVQAQRASTQANTVVPPNYGPTQLSPPESARTELPPLFMARTLSGSQQTDFRRFQREMPMPPPGSMPVVGNINPQSLVDADAAYVAAQQNVAHLRQQVVPSAASVGQRFPLNRELSPSEQEYRRAQDEAYVAEQRYLRAQMSSDRPAPPTAEQSATTLTGTIPRTPPPTRSSSAPAQAPAQAPAPNTARGRAALDQAQAEHARNIERQLGLSPALARAVAGGDVAISDAIRAHGGGSAAVASLLSTLGPEATGGATDAATERARLRQMQGLQRGAERTARAEGTPFSQIRSARLVAPSAFRVPEEFQGRFEREDGSPGQILAAARRGLPGTEFADERAGRTGRSQAAERERASAMQQQQRRAEQQARAQGTPFSQLSSARLVAPRAFRVPEEFHGAFAREGGAAGFGLAATRAGLPGTEFSPGRAGAGGGSSGGGGLGPGSGGGLFSGSNILRGTAALLGFGVGLNIAAGAATLLHDAIAAAVDSTVNLERSGRAVAIAYGATGRAFTGPGAAAFASNRFTAGTTTEFQGAVASAAPLAAQFNLNASQVQGLVTAEGELARLHGVELPQAASVLQSVLRGNLEAGQALDLQLTNEYGIIRGVGLTWQQLVQAQGPAAATATLLAAAQRDVDRQLQNNAQNADTTIDAFDRLGKAWDTFRSKVAQGGRGPVGAIATEASNILESPPSVGDVALAVSTPFGIPLAAAREVNRRAVPGIVRDAADLQNQPGLAGGAVRGAQELAQAGKDVIGQVDKNLVITAQNVVLNAQNVVNDVTKGIAANVAAGSANAAGVGEAVVAVVTDKLSGAAAQLPPEAQGALASAQGVLSGLQGAAGNVISTVQQAAGDRAAQGLDNLPGPLGDAVRAVEDFANAVQDKVNQLQRVDPANADREHAFQQNQRNLQRLNPGLGGQAEVQPPVLSPEEVTRQLKAYADEQLNTRASRQIQVAQITAAPQQLRIQALDLEAKDRQLDVQQQLNDYAAQRIQIENGLAPILLEQRRVQDQITIGTRENLSLTQAVLEARRAQTMTGSALETNTFNQTLAGLRAQSAIVSIVQGRAPKYDIGTQIGAIRGAAFAAPDIKIADAEAQHTLNLATVAQSIDQITKSINVIPLQQIQQMLDNEVILRNEELAAANASTEAINRALEFANLLAGPDRIDAERKFTAALIEEVNAKKAQADLLLSNTTPIQDIIVNVNVAGGVGAVMTPDTTSLLNQIAESATRGTLEAINRAHPTTPPQVPAGTAAAKHQ